MSDVKFSHSGRYMLTRDYLTVKVWDLNMEARPIETYQVGPGSRTVPRTPEGLTLPPGEPGPSPSQPSGRGSGGARIWGAGIWDCMLGDLSTAVSREHPLTTPAR